jgi:hypothetical protein
MELNSKEDLTVWILKDAPIQSHAELCNVLLWMFRVGLATPVAYRYGDWQETVTVDFSLNMSIQRTYDTNTLTYHDRITDVRYECNDPIWKELKEHMV